MAAVFVLPYVLKMIRTEKAVLDAHEVSLELGLFRPASLHPVVNPEQCIGTGNCVSVCPEQDVLGLLSGQAVPVSPARCIGHGLCERSCPVDAIQLVFGTAKRGVDLPRITENFESNVAGLFVVGELGGMGLIRNAFEQGRQCVEAIGTTEGAKDNEVFDVVIVGCGPAGLASALEADRKGLNYIVLEKDGIGGTVLNYPRKKLVMTEPMKLTDSISMQGREYVKEELLDMWEKVVEERRLNIRLNETVNSVRKDSEAIFSIQSSTQMYRARNVVLAIGRRGIPRKLGVTGEDRPNVSYSLKDPKHFAGDRILVVGGGDSAVEAAISLGKQTDTVVHISYRKDSFSRIKPDNKQRLDVLVGSGQMLLELNTNIESIVDGQVVLRHTGGDKRKIANDYVFIFAGGTLPTAFLNSCGIEINTVFGASTRSEVS